MSDSFVHLHNHTQFSLLDGAQKLPILFKKIEEEGMPAVAMSDHGNMFGAYEFFQVAKKTPVKPIIGIEAYLAPESRRYKKPVFWGPGGQRAVGDDGEGSKDVSGGGRFTHMTMWAENPDGLRNLFRLSSLASYEGYYSKPRMDKELISEHAERHHRHHRLPLGRGADPAPAEPVRRGPEGRRRVPGHLRQGELLP